MDDDYEEYVPAPQNNEGHMSQQEVEVKPLKFLLMNLKII